MTGRIAEEKIREIRERTDIVAIVSSYMPLRRSGANHQGLCPFHGEKTPSFNVNATRQIFHCFGCGVGGNVFSFLMRMEGLTFPEAVRRLGERVGIEVEEETLTPAEVRRREEAEQLGRVNEVACDFYHRVLLEEAEGEPGRAYLKERGYGRETARRFRLGYAPERWEALTQHLAAKGFDPRWGRELGLSRSGKEGRGEYDLFRRRLIFPILDARGGVVAFGGRVLDDALPKYLNSPESPLYHKGRILYGLHQAKEGMRQSGEGIVVEGYFDLLALHRAGFGNAVATCGTALTADHARLLKRYCGRLLLLFDQDSAGRKATFRAMDVLLAEGLPAAVVELDAGEDPDSFLRKRGTDAFKTRLAAARPVLELFIDETLAAGGESIEGRARAVEEINGKLRLLSSEIERSLYLKRLAERAGLDESVLRRGIGAGSAPAVVQPRRSESLPARRAEPAAGREGKTQDWLLHLLAVDARVAQRVVDEGVDALFSDPDRRAVAERMLDVLARERPLEEILHDEGVTEEQRAILSGILLKDEKAFAEESVEKAFADCRLAAGHHRLRQRSRELPALIRQAEREGEQGRLDELHAELLAINRRLKSGN